MNISERMTGNITDENIMTDVKNGKLSEMSVLFERYHVRLYNFFLKSGLNRDTSQDLTQNLFYRMIKYRHSYREGSTVKSWIYQIARNLHTDYCKKEKREETLYDMTDKIPEAINERDLFAEEDYEKLDKALALLSDEHREVIVLSRYQGLKYREISAITNQSVAAIKVTVHRAIKNLKSIYLNQI